MEEILRRWWRQAGEELAVLDMRVGLEIDQARHELTALARQCKEVVEREVLDRRPD